MGNVLLVELSALAEDIHVKQEASQNTDTPEYQGYTRIFRDQ